jgi:cell division septum initiation protein DivIVA
MNKKEEKAVKNIYRLYLENQRLKAENRELKKKLKAKKV